MSDRSPSVIVGIAGGTASGKSTLAGILRSAIESRSHSCISLGMDTYFRRTDPSAPRIRWSVTGEQVFDCNDIESADTDRMAVDLDTLAGAPDRHDVIFVEGLMVLASPKIRERCDLRIFVDLDADIRLARRLLRDTKSARGFTEPDKIISYYLESAHIGHKRFVEPSKVYADLTIRGDADFERVCRILLPSINGLIATKGEPR